MTNYNYSTTYAVTSKSQKEYDDRRKKDEKDEAIVGQFLDKYFYPSFTYSLSRNYVRDTQIKGLDITTTGNTGCVYTIDEKAATRWAGKNLRTFAHEISSVNKNGYVYNGWLLDSHSLSDFLVEVWIDGLNTIDNELYTYSDIAGATIAFVDKRKVWGYLKKRGCDGKEMLELGEYMRQRGIPYLFYKGLKVICQQTYQERAANVLIPRDVIINDLSTIAAEIKGKTTQKEITILHKTNEL